MLFLRSEGVWHTSSEMVHCSVSMSFPQGTELGWGRERGESGEELKLISCPLKTHVSFNHQLFPVLPMGSEGLWGLTAKPIRLDAQRDLFHLQSQSNNVWLYESSMAFILLYGFYSVFKCHSIIPDIWLTHHVQNSLNNTGFPFSVASIMFIQCLNQHQNIC